MLRWAVGGCFDPKAARRGEPWLGTRQVQIQLPSRFGGSVNLILERPAEKEKENPIRLAGKKIGIGEAGADRKRRSAPSGLHACTSASCQNRVREKPGCGIVRIGRKKPGLVP